MDPEELKVVGKEWFPVQNLTTVMENINNTSFSFVVYAARNLQPKKGGGTTGPYGIQNLRKAISRRLACCMLLKPRILNFQVCVMHPLFLALASRNIERRLYAITIQHGTRKRQCKMKVLILKATNVFALLSLHLS